MNSHIYKALLLHGHDKFNLEILEYCDKKYVLNREQYFIDLFKLEYNILSIASSS
jgi:group I intron endonuclease